MIISVVNQKGGVTKTTSTFNIAAILAKQGKKVLMLDLDPQSSLTISTGVEPLEVERNIYHVMCEKVNVKDAVLQLEENLFLVPSSIDLSVAELNLVNEMARESILKKALAGIKDYFDYIFIDCPPSLGLLVINALCASDRVLIPVATDYLSYRGLNLLLDTVDKVQKNLNPDIKIMGVIATLFDKRTLHAKEVLAELQENHNVLGTISISVQAKDSILAGKALVDYNKNHVIVQEYEEIVKAILASA